jgi:hypothetical protein
MKRAHTRRWFVVAVIGLAAIAFGAQAVRNLFHVPFLGSGSNAIHAPGSLPQRIDVCGRDWTRSATETPYTMAEITAMSGTPPALVGAGPLPACPEGACTRGQNQPCSTVIFVRVADDGYVAYALSGGP